MPSPDTQQESRADYERQVANAYRQARAEMGLSPDDGNNDNTVPGFLRYAEDWEL